MTSPSEFRQKSLKVLAFGTVVDSVTDKLTHRQTNVWTSRCTRDVQENNACHYANKSQLLMKLSENERMWLSDRFIYWMMKNLKTRNIFLMIFIIYLTVYFFQVNTIASVNRSRIRDGVI